MALKFDENEIKEWANELKDYSASRTNFFKPQNITQKITHKNVKDKEFQFHPILQEFRNKDEV